MNIIVTVSHDELRKLNIGRDQVRAVLYDALDKALLPNGEKANFDATVEVEWEQR